MLRNKTTILAYQRPSSTLSHLEATAGTGKLGYCISRQDAISTWYLARALLKASGYTRHCLMAVGRNEAESVPACDSEPVD
jgi:hypothetical protein